MVKSITAEGLFSVSYTSTRLGDLATGFNMTISGPSGLVEGKKKVTVSNGTQTASWGSDEGVVLNKGQRLSRNYEGSSSVIVDPIYDLFQKIVYFALPETTFSDKVESVGAFVFLNDLRVREEIFENLRTGEIEKFLEALIQPPSNIKIDYGKVEESPIVKALKGNTAHGNIQANTVNVARNTMLSGQIFSVGKIFTQFIAPLGLELYWEKDGHYSLEPPRLSSNHPKSEATIKKEDIIDLRITTDPYNVPDVVIPSSLLQESLGSVNGDVLIAKSLSAGILDNVTRKNLKISTYDIPSFLSNPVFNAVRAMEALDYDNYHGGIPSHTIQDSADDIARFYGSHARKSSLYKQKTGECIMVLSPDITKAYSWYIIDGKMCFVSDIRHEITRSSAVTILTIAGIHDPSILTDNSSPGSSSNVPQKEKNFIDGLKSKAVGETKKIKQDVKEGSQNTKTKSGKILEEDDAKIFGDYKEFNNIVNGTAVGQAVDFTPKKGN